MVQVGNFSVEIINADGRIAFPEHQSEGGEVYVEVEPDAEYYIRVKSDSEDQVKAYVYFSVDGNDLGYNCNLSKKGKPQEKGLWENKDGKSCTHALKFAKAPVREAAGHETFAPFWTGKVEVRFHEATFRGYKEQKDAASKWNGGSVS